MSPKQYLELAQAELGKTKAGFHPNIFLQGVKVLRNRDSWLRCGVYLHLHLLMWWTAPTQLPCHSSFKSTPFNSSFQFSLPWGWKRCLNSILLLQNVNNDYFWAIRLWLIWRFFSYEVLHFLILQIIFQLTHKTFFKVVGVMFFAFSHLYFPNVLE